MFVGHPLASRPHPENSKMADSTLLRDAASAQSFDEWLLTMEDIGEETGYFQPLGSDHWAFFVDESPTLIVTFETLDGILSGSANKMPLGHNVARERGWSHLCLVARGDSWYRDPHVYGFVDRLVDDAFFEDFDRVLFYGAGMCGYAAAAFSVAAPGATVLLSAPQATLDPAIAGWDPRFRERRRLDFTSRYGYAPDMIEGAGEVFIIHDPESAPDAIHAALFRKPFVTHLRLPGSGRDPAAMIHGMGHLLPLLTLAAEGRLTAAEFHRRMRDRHGYLPFLRHLLARADQRNRPTLSARICRTVLRDHSAPRFRKRLAEIEALAADAPPAP